MDYPQTNAYIQDMCYDVEAHLNRQLKEARKLGVPKSELDRLWEQLKEIQRRKSAENQEDSSSWEDEQPSLGTYYHISGFSHPDMFVITSLENPQVIRAQWGFIPLWVKSFKEAYDYKKPYNCNLNAQVENMFESRAFKRAALNKRCVIQVEGYYENHHRHKTTYPFYIGHFEEKPLWLAGIYENNQFVDEDTGEITEFKSFAILTCQANGILSQIHNNPKMVARTGHRMLAILNESQLPEYLTPFLDTGDPQEKGLWKKNIDHLIQPYDENLLSYHTVRNLKRRKDMDYIGNVPAIKEEYLWEGFDTASIFS